MEVGKYYYVVMRNNQIYANVIPAYAENIVIEEMLETTKDIQQAKIYKEYSDAKETADKFDLEVKKIRADILGLGSR